MPESSRYFDDESDHESVSDLLSPSDGYFADGHQHPGDVMVPDPSQASSRIDKEREAAEEMRAVASSRHTNTPSPIHASSSSHHNTQAQSPPRSSVPPRSPIREAATESTPLIPSAPPAYSPPEPGSPYHAQHARNLSTGGIYETMGRAERFFPNTPENIADGSRSLLGEVEDKKPWKTRISAWWDKNHNKVFKYLCLSLAILLGFGFIVDAAIELSTGNNSNHGRDGGAKHPGLVSEIPSSCKIIGQGSIDFTWEKSQSLHLLHLPKPEEVGSQWTRIENIGKIHVRPAPEDAKEDVKVDLNYYYSAKAVAGEIEFSKEDDLLKVSSAGSVQNYGSPADYRPCLYLNFTVWVKPGLKQERFEIGTTTLSVIMETNYTAKAEGFYITTLAGSVHSSADANGEVHWGGRDIRVVTDASSITGAFPLYDSLHLETHSGSITTDLTLHPGRNYPHSEALLTLKSVAGSITVDTPILTKVEKTLGNATIDDIPLRDYHTDIDARSGSVNVKLAHGSRTSVRCTAGSVNMALTPMLEPRKDSHIIVDSKTGGIDVTVNDAVAYPGERLRNLYGDYTFATGHLTLRYPTEWEGRIKGQLLTGQISAEWPGLQVTKRQRDGVFTNFEAVKGSGNSVINFAGASGSANLIGKGGQRYPSDTDDHRRIIIGDDSPHGWPIVLPPMLKAQESEESKESDESK